VRLHVCICETVLVCECVFVHVHAHVFVRISVHERVRACACAHQASRITCASTGAAPVVHHQDLDGLAALMQAQRAVLVVHPRGLGQLLQGAAQRAQPVPLPQLQLDPLRACVRAQAQAGTYEPCPAIRLHAIAAASACALGARHIRGWAHRDTEAHPRYVHPVPTNLRRHGYLSPPTIHTVIMRTGTHIQAVSPVRVCACAHLLVIRIALPGLHHHHHYALAAHCAAAAAGAGRGHSRGGGVDGVRDALQGAVVGEAGGVLRTATQTSANDAVGGGDVKVTQKCAHRLMCTCGSQCIFSAPACRLPV